MDTLKRILMMAMAILIPATSVPVHGAGIETLLMPGEVIQGHAKLEHVFMHV